MIIQPVTDPLKIVTDVVLISALEKQGIDKNYIEFYQDYALPSIGKKEKSPYAKFYRDLKSNKKFAIISGLPRVNALGVMCEAGWLLDGKKYTSKANQFTAEVARSQVTIGIFNDQPLGVKAGQSLTYIPSVYKGTKKVVCGLPSLIDDPLNENYLQNTLEWDYGICKRRLRLIEGQIQGCWVFTDNPKADVKFIYNQSGDFKLKLGQYATDSDTELVTKAVFDTAEYPFKVSDTYTAYPDADPESTTVDGHVYESTGTTDWATMRNAAGDGASDASQENYFVRIASTLITNQWGELWRSIFLFNVASIPDNATDISTVFSLRGLYKGDTFTTPAVPDINIYSSAPASNTALAAGDYDSLGETPFSDTITYANFSITGYNAFALNAAGLTALAAAIAGDNILKIGARNVNHDVANSAPTWAQMKVAYLYGYFSDQGAGYQPKLVVTYTPAVTAYSNTLTTSIGLSASLGRATGYNRSLTTAIGLSVALQRIEGFVRSLTTASSLSATLSQVFGYGRSLSTAIGLSASLSRATTYGRSLTASIGLTSALSRSINIARSLTTSIGMSVNISRAVSYARSLSSQIGLSSILSRSVGVARSLSTAIGLTAIIYRSQGLYRTLTTAIGMHTLLIWGGRFKRRLRDVGTDRTSSVAGERTITTAGTNRDIT